MQTILQYFYNIASVLDRVINTALGGDPRQTLSSRMGRDIALGRCRACGWICAGLNLIQLNHCAKAWASEQIPLSPDMQTTGD